MPCSEENVNDSSLKCRPNRRGKSMALDDRKDIGPHEVSFNHRGQPVGRYAAKFASFLGVTARNLVPLTISDWRILSTDFKNQLWDHVIKENSLDPDSIGRSDVWLEAYGSKNKDGAEDDIEDAEIVQKVKKMKLNEASSSVMDDVVAQVLGPERRERVRGLGFGALPSKVDGQAHASIKNSKLEREVHELKLSVQKILAKLELKDENNGNDDIRSSSGELSNNKNKNAPARSVNNASVCGEKEKSQAARL